MKAGEKLFQLRKQLLQLEPVLSTEKGRVNRLKLDITKIRNTLPAELFLFNDPEHRGFMSLTFSDLRSLWQTQDTEPKKLVNLEDSDIATQEFFTQFEVFLFSIANFYGIKENNKPVIDSTIHDFRLSIYQAVQLLSDAMSVQHTMEIEL
jgi:hypothetical protein